MFHLIASFRYSTCIVNLVSIAVVSLRFLEPLNTFYDFKCEQEMSSQA